VEAKRRHGPTFIFFRIQRAKSLTVGHVHRAQMSISFRIDTMVKSSVPPHAPVALPPLVAAYVEAANSFDAERLMATFAEMLSSMISCGTTEESRLSESGRRAISSVRD
jgi:hypothetical protein